MARNMTIELILKRLEDEQHALSIRENLLDDLIKSEKDYDMRKGQAKQKQYIQEARLALSRARSEIMKARDSIWEAAVLR